MQEGTILYEIRCPNNAWKGNTNRMICNSMGGRVNALTMGEFHCRKCKVPYHFTVNEDGTVDYFFEPTEIKQRYDRLSPEDRLLAALEQHGN